MAIEVWLQTVARFGKRDGASDYRWLMGRSDIPSDIFSVCEPLSRLAAASNSAFSLVTEHEGIAWLVRTYIQGVDNAFRPTSAVEVASVISPINLVQDQRIGLAAISAQPAERERIREPGRFNIFVTDPQVAPISPDQELLARIRLGVPATATLRAALSAVKYHPWRYRGICFALRGKNDAPPDAPPEILPYFCVNFAEPRLSEQERAALVASLSRAISPDEWATLDRIESKRCQEAICWSANPTPPSPIRSADDPMMDWLMAFRRSNFSGPDLLVALRKDIAPHSIRSNTIRKISPELSEEAALFLAEAKGSTTIDSPPEILEELAQSGYLSNPEIMPFRSWSKYCGLSRNMIEQSLLMFGRMGVSQPAAKFVLGSQTPDAPVDLNQLESIREAASIASEAGLDPPRFSMVRLLQSVSRVELLWPLDRMKGVYGNWAEAALEMISEGSIPDEGLLIPEEMLAIAEFRERVLRRRGALLDALSSLAQSDRLDEAVSLLKIAQTSPALRLSAAAIRVLEARLKHGKPSPPAGCEEMKLLIDRGLARPEDVIPEAEGENGLVICARLWEQTFPLAEIIELSENTLPRSAPECPDRWKPVVAHLLTPFKVKRWFEKLGAEHLQQAREWMATILDIDQKAMRAFCGEEEMTRKAEEIRPVIPWLDALLTTEPRSRRLDILSKVARSGVAGKDDEMAYAIVRSLFPEENSASLNFAAHALSGVGPLPPLDGASPDLLIALISWVDVVSLINALFSGDDAKLSSDKQLGEALLDEVRRKGAAYPQRGYTARQIDRHLVLAVTIGGAYGWEPLAPDLTVRARYANRVIEQLGLRPEDLNNLGAKQIPMQSEE